MSPGVIEAPERIDPSSGRRWNYGFAALVRVTSRSPHGSGEIMRGSGVLVAPRLVVTAKHVLCLNGREAVPGDLTLCHAPSGAEAHCQRLQRHSDLDLALLWLDADLPAQAVTWMNGGAPMDLVPTGTLWRGFGFPLESGGQRACQQVLADHHPSPGSDAAGDLVRIMVAKGLPYGYSGGPVFLECEGRRLFAGIGKLGGDGSSVTEVLPSDEILSFLRQHVPDVGRGFRTQSAAEFFSGIRRRRVWNSIGALILACGVLGLAWWGWTVHQAKEREKARQAESARVQEENAAKEEAARIATVRASEKALEALRAFTLRENATLPLFGRVDRAPFLEPISNNPAMAGRLPLYQDLPLLKQVEKEDLIRQQATGRRRTDEFSDFPQEPAAPSEMAIRAWEEAALRQRVVWEKAAPVEQLFGNAKSPPRFVVLGPPGSGKSTFLRALACKLAKGQIRYRSETLIPIQIELREWESWHGRHGGSLADYLAAFATDIATKNPSLEDLRRVSSSIVNSWLEQGRVCVMLDGLDEIRGEQRFTELLEANLKTPAWGKTSLLLACRTVSFETHQRFCPSFVVYRVGELTREQRDAYVRAYPARYPAELEAELLIKELDRLPGMEPLWGNPLLLSLICYAVDGPERMGLPARRSELYDRVVTQVLAEWEKSRLKELKDVDPDDLLSRRVLERVALDLFASWDRARKLSFGKEEFNAALVRALTAEGVARSIAGPLQQHLTAKPGLLRRSREGEYAFLHLTLHEYLAGACLARLAGASGGWDSMVILGAGTGTLRSLVDAKAWDPAWREVVLFMAGSLSDPVPLLRLLADGATDAEGRPRLRLAILCREESAARAQPLLDRLPSADPASLVALGGAFLKAFLGPQTIHWVDREAAIALLSLAKAGYIEPVLARLVELIHDPGDDVRERAASALDRLSKMAATEQVLTGLLQLSRDPDAGIRSSAAYALGRLGETAASEPVLTQLAELTRDPDAGIRSSAARGLGGLGKKAATEPVLTRLVELIGDSEDEVFASAAYALRNLGEGAAIEPVLARLVELSRDTGAETRSKAAEALGIMGEKAAIEPVLLRLLELMRDPDAEVSESASDSLCKLGDKAATQPVLAGLVEMIRSPNDVVRDNATYALSKLGDEGATEQVLTRVLELLQDSDIEVLYIACFVLGKLGEKAATEPVLAQLTELLQNPDAEVAAIAGITLNRLGEMVVAPLVRLSRDPDAEVRSRAAYAMARLGDKVANELVLTRLIELRQDPDAGVRRCAAGAIGRLGERAAINLLLVPLVEFSKDPDAEVRSSAVNALGDLGEKAATDLVVARLVELIRDRDAAVRISAASALGQLGKKAATELVVARLVGLSRDTDAETSFWAAYALCQLGEVGPIEMVLTQLVERSRHPEAKVRGQAAHDLGQLGERAATGRVLDRLVELTLDPDEIVCRLAAAALGQLGRKGASNSVLARLTEMSRNQDLDVRNCAANALRAMCKAAATELVLGSFVEMIRDPDEGLRSWVASNLARLGEKAATEPVLVRLVELSRDPDAGVRLCAAYALCGMGETAARQLFLGPLLELSRGSDASVRAIAAVALRQMGEKGATEPVLARLVELSRDQDAEVRGIAADALGRLGEHAATEEVLARLLELIRDAEDPVREMAAEALGDLGRKAATEAVLGSLLELSRDRNPEPRKAAVKALCEMGASAATGPVLVRLLELRRETDAEIRSSAVTGLKQLYDNGLRWFSVADGHVRFERVETLAQWPPKGTR